MSLQSVINLAESIEINRRRIVGVQFTRNEIVRVSETPGRNPWRLTVQVSAPIPYENARSILEDIDRSDRSDPETITFSDNPGLDYLFAYQGTMNSTNLAALRVQSFTGTNLTLSGVPTTGATSLPGSLLFKKGDFIQVNGFPYPFTVINDVQRGTGSAVTATTHRPNFISDSLVNQGVKVGNAVEFQMICTNMPIYTLVPGGRTAMVQFNDSFQLYEFTGTV
jgi:hypothetical protein